MKIRNEIVGRNAEAAHVLMEEINHTYGLKSNKRRRRRSDAAQSGLQIREVKRVRIEFEFVFVPGREQQIVEYARQHFAGLAGNEIDDVQRAIHEIAVANLDQVKVQPAGILILATTGHEVEDAKVYQTQYEMIPSADDSEASSSETGAENADRTKKG